MHSGLTRRAFGASAMLVPRHVLGGAGYIAPSDRVTVASIGMGRQGMVVTMDLLSRPDVQVVAVCDCNRGSKEYAEYGDNALLKAARRLLGPGFENWGEDLASPGRRQFTRQGSTSLGMGGREPARRLVEAYYGARLRGGSYKGCTAWRDYRELLENEKDLDAVYIATPDHWHAPISLAAMRRRKHVLCQKPMTHSIGEAHRVAEVAREMKVATAVTVNNPTTQSTRLIASWIAEGAIGRVLEVHNWSNRPSWPQGIERPRETPPVPENLDWDLWVGPAPERPYHPAYLPFVWRGWYDFGCGSFGDMGCYSFAGIFKILDLTPPTAVECCSTESFEETYPKASIVHLDFPARGGRRALRVTWYDGGLRPPRPAGLKPQQERLFRHRGEGVMYVGEKGFILGGFNGDDPVVYPESPKYRAPEAQRGGGAQEAGGAVDQWIAACKGGPAPASDFASQTPVTEAFLLGCLAQRFPAERLEWDSAAMRVSSPAAQRWVDPPYRPGYV